MHRAARAPTAMTRNAIAGGRAMPASTIASWSKRWCRPAWRLDVEVDESIVLWRAAVGATGRLPERRDVGGEMGEAGGRRQRQAGLGAAFAGGALGNDGASKAELGRLLEPRRRLGNRP